jgi:hypothetical protein
MLQLAFPSGRLSHAVPIVPTEVPCLGSANTPDPLPTPSIPSAATRCTARSVSMPHHEIREPGGLRQLIGTRTRNPSDNSGLCHRGGVSSPIGTVYTVTPNRGHLNLFGFNRLRQGVLAVLGANGKTERSFYTFDCWLSVRIGLCVGCVGSTATLKQPRTPRTGRTGGREGDGWMDGWMDLKSISLFTLNLIL